MGLSHMCWAECAQGAVGRNYVTHGTEDPDRCCQFGPLRARTMFISSMAHRSAASAETLPEYNDHAH
jgi:hypothetical protein